MLELTITHANGVPAAWIIAYQLAALAVQFCWLLATAAALRIAYEYLQHIRSKK